MLTFTNVTEPDVLQRARALAVDAFQLPRSDDDVGDARAIFENEHSAVAACVGIGVTITSAIELLVAVVDRAGNRGGRGQGDDRTRASRDVESLSGGEGHQRGEKGGGVQHLVNVFDVLVEFACGGI